MQGRVKQANGHGQSRHDAEQFSEIITLHRQEFGQGFLTTRRIGRHDHLTHRDDPVGIKEHMLRARQADAFSAEITSRLRV